MSDQLEYPFLYSWHSADGVSVIGRAWSGDRLLEGSALIDPFREVASEDSFKTVLLNLNGFFAVVLDKGSFRAAAVDHIRSFPLIYKAVEHGFELMSDYAWRDDYELDASAARVFSESWCTLGNKTLLQGYLQLEAGQYIWADAEQDIRPRTYYYHYRPKLNTPERVELRKSAAEVFESVFERVIAELSGRPVVVPLSGGYDSRMLLTMLVKAGYPNVTAYTYGCANGHEAQIASAVAAKLDVNWYFVEYNETVFRDFFMDSWNDYSRKNHFYTSLPHEQDFFALKQLKDRELLPDGFVAMPGFCGDALGGSITAYEPAAYTEAGLRQLIEKKHLGKDGVEVELPDSISIVDEASFYDAYQHWYTLNKVSKFIVNAVRVYEYFGGEWLMPFWDRELVEFWYTVPYAYRRRQNLYNEVLFSRYFEPMGIGFQKPGFDDNYPHRWKEKLKDHLPDAVQGILRSILPQSATDVNKLEILEQLIRERIVGPPSDIKRGINRCHAQYFLQNLNK